LLNPRNDSYFDNEVLMEPAVANYPVLLVKGSIIFQYDTTLLRENAYGGNFNPPGTPYNGVSNNNQTDTYPSILNGLVYVSGDLNVKSADLAIAGPLIVGGNL